MVLVSRFLYAGEGTRPVTSPLTSSSGPWQVERHCRPISSDANPKQIQTYALSSCFLMSVNMYSLQSFHSGKGPIRRKKKIKKTC